ncbi:MAG: glycosyltransferase family 4 protein [Microcoleus sp. SIO2G3]|nr:glycosyltransferase family 4 protein [Microcoleus sp. SIO2G3]
MQQIRVGFLSAQNYLDRTAWSGTLFYMQQALQRRGLEVVYLGDPQGRSTWLQKLRRLSRKLHTLLRGSSDTQQQQQFADRVRRQLRQVECDVIFAPVASSEVITLETETPLVYLSDATAKLIHYEYLREFASSMKDIPTHDEALQQAEQAEAIAIAKAHCLVYPSSWAARSAIADYGADQGKVSVIQMGANLENPPTTEEVLARRRPPAPGEPLRLLFIGSNWERKGGNIAYDMLLSLLDRGVDAELTIVGCVPPAKVRHPKLRVIPFLNKNLPRERQQLDDLFWQAHLFVLPTRAECYGMVLCESGAFGLPVLVAEVGGIPSVIMNGRNGYLFSLAANGSAYADVAIELCSDPARYQKVVQTSREEYDQRLNWDSWADHMKALLGALKTNANQHPRTPIGLT